VEREGPVEQPVIMLGSNNYLGLTTDPRVRAADAGDGTFTARW
jgi:hypothetical protein